MSTTPTYYDWIVKAENSDLTLTGGSVKGTGHKTRGVGSTAGSKVILDGVTVTTLTGGGTNWGSHGVQADEAGSTLNMNGGSISTTGEYSNGIQAGAGGFVMGRGVTITADGGNSHTFGVEANNGGSVDLEGGSIEVKGKNAGGARAYTGNGKSDKGLIKLVGTGVSVTGAAAIGLMAGDKDGTAPASTGDIVFRNADVSVSGTNAIAARALAGGVLTIDNATFMSSTASGDATGVFVDGPGSALNATNLTIRSTGSSRAKGVVAENGGTASIVGGTIETSGGMNSHAMDAFQTGSVITATDVDVKTTGYAAGAFNGAEVVLTRGVFDVVGTTATVGWDTAAGFVVGGSAANSKLTAQNVTLINSAALLNAPPTYTSSALRVGADFGTALNSQAEMSLTNSEVIASGSQRRIALIENNSHLIATNSHLSSEQDEGIALVNNAKLTLDGTAVEAKKESLRSQFSTAGTQTITVGSGSTLSKNNGTLLLVKRETAGDAGKVSLILEAGAYASGNIENLNAAGERVTVGTDRTFFEVRTGAHWAGLVLDANTKDESNVNDGETITGDVAVSSGSNVAFNGNTFNSTVASGANSNISFNGATTIGGNALGQSGSTMSFSGPATITGGVTGVGSNFQFNGPTQIGGSVALGGGSTLGGGTVDAPIEIGGDVDVSEGSVLGGNLNVGGALSGSGGTLAPGNSIGSQTYGSVAGFGGRYVAEINAAGQSDFVRISGGDADLKGIALEVRQENGNGGYMFGHEYTILETVKADGISNVLDNKFQSAALDGSFVGTLVELNPVNYGANYVRISLSKNADALAAERATWSRNQSAVMSGLGGNPLDYTVATMQPDVRKDALNQLSGEVHASTQSALLNNSSLITRTLTNRMRGNLGAGMQAGAPTAQSTGAVAGSMPTSTAHPLWAEVVGSWSTLDDNGNAAEVKSNVAGLFIGGDTAVGNGWRVGGALGFTDGKIEVNDRSSKSDVTSYTAALYGGNSWAAESGKVNFLAGAAYTRHEVDSRRSVTVGGNQTLKADYDVNTTQLFTELGYAIPVGQASEVEPYLGVAWLSQKAKSFTETGGSAALHGDSQKDDVTTFTLGLRGKTAVDVGANQASLYAGLGWRHASGDVEAERRMNFVQGNSVGFKVAGAPIAKNAAVVDLGAEMAVGKNAAMGLGYSGQFGNGNTDSTGSLYLKVKF
ncbi:autotransporter outer membrane beta-barrel domain-containing protein [Pollutimonas thiosulfatoxidans]|uniref:autotransporter outer membrane beta-barrel domain-containing protein n=1 Tax=Pollutimonas thiosulfatoxidans TaxID=2028345 RepID=UPI001A7EADC9|nr:autotransporter outer membrane beta-barrel domain-containing protein [Pollutimonas thiosulfatoxidans]